MGAKAYVCQVCYLYTQTNKNISDVYEESRKLAEKKIKGKKDLELELQKMRDEDDVDLTTDEFDELEEDIQMKFEKRKAGKEDLEDSEEFAEVECPFCGELFDDLANHIRECEFAPDDVSMDDIMPQRKKKRKRKTTAGKGKGSTAKAADKKACPYCKREYARLGRHIKACKKRPANPDEDKEAQFLKGEIDSI